MKISFLSNTTALNRIRLLDFAGQICIHSRNLLTLCLESTCSKAEEGDALMLGLANNAINMTTLQYLIIKGEVAWFARGREECLEPLLIVI